MVSTEAMRLDRRSERGALTESHSYQLSWPIPHGQEVTLLGALFPGRRLILPDQVHGTDVKYVDRFSPATPQCDGLITDDPSVVLLARGADCPIITAAAGRVSGIMHSGWKGTLADAPGELIYAMVQVGAQKSDIRIHVSPGIRQCCYEVPIDDNQDRIQRFEEAYPDIAVEYRGPRVFLNLQRAIVQSLLSQGLDLEQIHIDPRCTCCSQDTLPSHRREGHARTTSLVGAVFDQKWDHQYE